MKDLNFVTAGGNHAWALARLNPNAPCRAVIDWMGNGVWGT